MLVVRFYRPADRTPLRELLGFLAEFYPGAGRWLDARFDLVEQGDAYCMLVVAERPVGVLIETPQGRGRLQLSAFHVEPAYLDEGVGDGLLGWAELHWPRRVETTVAEERAEELGPLLEEHNFRPVACLKGRFRPGHGEIVYRYDRPLLVSVR